MCKILVLTHVKNQSNALKFMHLMSDEMSMGNRDGLGYTAIKADGTIFTERWLENNEAFIQRGKSVYEKRIEENLSDIIEVPTNPVPKYSLQGERDLKSFVSVIMHTRMATSAKGFFNTHPFVDNENKTSIIHNGIIRNDTEFKKLNSTCDSEVFLTEYNRLDIANNVQNIKKLTPTFEGYWATAITSLTSDNKRVLDVFKSDTSSLYLCYIPEIGGVVFSTSDRDITDCTKKLGWNKPETYKVKGDIFLRFNPFDGSIVERFSVPAAKTWTWDSSKYNKSYCGSGYEEESRLEDWHHKKRGGSKIKGSINKDLAVLASSQEASDSKYNNEQGDVIDAEIKALSKIEQELSEDDAVLINQLPDELKLGILKAYKDAKKA